MRKNNRFWQTLVVAAFIMVAAAAQGQVPQLINYQGQLTDDNGNPLNRKVAITFKIFSVPTLGTALYTETHSGADSVVVSNGVFDVLIGSINPSTNPIPLDLFDSGTERYLEVTVNNTVLTPRRRFGSVPYAFRSRGGSSTAGVNSLNGLQGNVTLSAGSNVSITPSGNSLVIAASGGGGGGDNLGNHTATQNILLNGNWLSNDGGNEGIQVGNDGTVTGTNANGNVGRLGRAGQGVQGAHTNGNYGYVGSETEGVFGRNNNGNTGALGRANQGAYGGHTSGNFGALGSETVGAFGQHKNNHVGLLGTDSVGVIGIHFTSKNYGGLGLPKAGVEGHSNNDNWGRLGSNNSGAYGENANGNFSQLGTASAGAFAQHTNGNRAYLGTANEGVYTDNANGNRAILAGANEGVYAQHANGNSGRLGTAIEAIVGRNSNGNLGLIATAQSALHGQHSGGNFGTIGMGSVAGRFGGNVDIQGTLFKSGGSFKIDHPLDPANKYLYHSFVESPDMMNVYNGNVVLDANGEAVVELPNWFEALNRDFRYQLTAIGAPGPNLYVAEKIAGNRFKIAGGVAGAEVSWQVTGIRQDAFANAHRIQVEVEKQGKERGKYLHPEAHGAPETLGELYETRAAMKQRAEQMQQAAERAQQAREAMPQNRPEVKPAPRPRQEGEQR